MNKPGIDLDDGDLIIDMGGNMGMDSDGNLMINIGGNMAMDLETGDIHIVTGLNNDNDN